MNDDFSSTDKDVVVVGYISAAENREKGGRGSYWYANSLDGERLNTAASRQDLVAQLEEFEVVNVDDVGYYGGLEYTSEPEIVEEEEDDDEEDILYYDDEE